MKTSLSRILLILAAFALSVGFTACNSTEESEDSQAQDSTAVATVANEPEEDSVSIVLPSPLQIATLFKKSGLTYLEGLTNDPANASKYSSTNKRALNAGAYTTDLAYCVLNKQTQKAMDYVKTVRSLGAQMGMSAVFDNNSFVDRFEKNLNNEDSLAYVVADLQMETDMYLENNDMTKLSPIMFAGAWVEALYIGSKVYEKKQDDKLNHKITEQMIILDKVISLLEKYSKDDEELAGYVASLKDISTYYNSIPSVQQFKSSEEESEVKLTQDELKQLSSKIIEARNKIVNA